MNLPTIILAACNSREAALWTHRSKRRSRDNFQADLGSLREFARSYPKGGQEATQKFFSGPWHKQFERICPKSPSGEAILEKMKQLTPSLIKDV